VRVLIFHGYLLRGTGSNVFNASLARALARLGHDVHLLCQDRGAAELGWVDRAGEWEAGELQVRDAAGTSPGTGSITVYRPDIGGLLPVYVLDKYEGFDVKTFSQLTEAELGRYLSANVAAVRAVAELTGGVEAAQASHLVMGPAILARAGLTFAAKIHGSALEYTVKPEPERFLPYAVEGMQAAACVLVGSRHTAESLWTALDLPGLPDKSRLGPPGVDTTLFSPISGHEAKRSALRELANTLHPRAARREGGPRTRTVGSEAEGPPPPATGPAAGSAWGRDPARAAKAVEWFADATGPRVVLVAKLIISKGVDLALAAWPLVLAAKPGARLLVVGFGEAERALLALWSAIESGDVGGIRTFAERGRELEGGPAGSLRMLLAFLDSRPAGYEQAARGAAGSVAFAGRLEHDEVGQLVPAADVLLFPSTFPEAFGMVAAEAAAAGVAPVSAEHSGAAEVSRALAADLPPEAVPLVSFPLGDEAVAALAERINGWLALDPTVGAEARTRLRATASRLWSWEGVARDVLAASAGRLDELAPIARQ
jgi:glycosyltransferase involved in cell wall biosynthesis